MITLTTYNVGLIRFTALDMAPIQKWTSVNLAVRDVPIWVNQWAQHAPVLRPLAEVVHVLNQPFFKQADWVDERLDYLPSLLRESDADVLCLQEVFDLKHRIRLSQALAQTYPFHAWTTGERLVGLCDGLMIFSKYPISAWDYQAFSIGPLEELLSLDKGVLFAKIELPRGPVAVYNAHPTSGGVMVDCHGPIAQWYRRQQYRQMFQFIEKTRADLPVLVTGDMNAGPEASRDNYFELLQAGYDDAFDIVRRRNPEKIVFPYTLDPKNPLNHFLDQETEPSARIDHVLLSKGHPFAVKSADIIYRDHLVPIPGGQKVPASDHYGLKVVMV